MVIVHGITNSAGTFERIRQYFLNHEYGGEEIYGTTYGDAGKTNVLFVTMQCHYVKIVGLWASRSPLNCSFDDPFSFILT